ncbi:MAG TPA: signal peptide peptidase SppA [Alphaproteobacteria bacterium]|nr:signal peptide peptidase SppA [Alphaproteobacteria bacterium]
MTGSVANTTEEKLFMMLKLDKAKRRWRLLAVLLFLITLALLFLNNNKTEQVVSKKENYIAEIKIEGIILEDDYRLKRLETLKDDEHAKAVILTIDSPGGAMVPGLEILESLKEIAEVKPLVVQMKTVAASAGFLISLSGDYVVANKATLTASIGVLMPLVDATELAEKIGIKSAEITSGELKSITSPINRRSDKAQNYLQTTVNELQTIFMDEVKQRRTLTPEVEAIVSDGRVLIGKKAFEYGLIDSLGNKSKLLEFLHTEKEISKDLELVEYSLLEPEKTKFQDILADQLTSSIANKLNMYLESYTSVPKMIAK